jgi:hypothetical protein
MSAEKSTLGYIRSLAECVTGEPEPRDWDAVLSHMSHHENQNPAISAYVCRLLKGKVVLDLGCGVLGSGYHIAKFAGAKKYIAVEKHYKHYAEVAIGKISTPDVPHEIVEGAMVNYVRYDKPSADAVFLVGIDELVVHPWRWGDLMEGAYGLLPDEGCIFIGGGWTKLWSWIDHYFERDEVFEQIVGQETEHLSSYAQINFVSIFKKKPNATSRWAGSL